MRCHSRSRDILKWERKLEYSFQNLNFLMDAALPAQTKVLRSFKWLWTSRMIPLNLIEGKFASCWRCKIYHIFMFKWKSMKIAHITMAEVTAISLSLKQNPGSNRLLFNKISKKPMLQK